MARINYGGLAKAIKSVIEADPSVRDYDATVEVNPGTVALEKFPHVAVYERKHALTAGQPLAAGQQTRKRLQWEVIVSAIGKNFEEASETRDDLLGCIEVALMGNRALGGALTNGSLMLAGGDLTGGPVDTGVISQGSIMVTAEATASV